MKQALYFECFSGISGDMSVASLIDLGVDIDGLNSVLDSIDAHGFTTKISRVNKSGIDCCDFDVVLDNEHENHDHDMEYLYGDKVQHNHHHHHEHRGFYDIKDIIEVTTLTENAKRVAIRIFEIIANAEALAHNKPFDEVHFHEVGAIDSIVDIVAFAYCFDAIGIEEVIVPFLCEGWGSVRCQHGVLPVPVPAVVNISSAEDIALRVIDIKGELVTPTGCAIVGAVRTSKTLPDSFTVKKVGLGAGKRAYDGASGIVRAMIIEY